MVQGEKSLFAEKSLGGLYIGYHFEILFLVLGCVYCLSGPLGWPGYNFIMSSRLIIFNGVCM